MVLNIAGNFTFEGTVAIDVKSLQPWKKLI